MSESIDLKNLLVQGYLSREVKSKNGKLQFTVRSQTLADRLFVLGEPDSTRGPIAIALGIVSFGDKVFNDQEKAIAFVNNLNPTIAKKISSEQDKLANEVFTTVNKWADVIDIPKIEDNDIVNGILNGDRIITTVRDPAIPFTLELQTLTLSEEMAATAGREFGEGMTERDLVNLQCDFLMSGIKSMGGRTFKDTMEAFQGLRQLPYALISPMFRWHSQLSGRVREVLNEESNF